MLRRGASVGKPIKFSISPVMHNAAYKALGLTDWQYERREIGEGELEDFVRGLGPEWVGLSVTMPLKREALAIAQSSTPRARAIGAANTLVRREGSWEADNTDAPGMVDALTEAGLSHVSFPVVLGAGGTAQAALSALSELHADTVIAVVRNPERAVRLQETAQRLDVNLELRAFTQLPECVQRADVLISTLPFGVADMLVSLPFDPKTVVMDVVFTQWPTPFAAAAEKRGCKTVSGLSMLLYQATYQVKAMTGREAPVEAMREALYEAVNN